MLVQQNQITPTRARARTRTRATNGFRNLKQPENCARHGTNGHNNVRFNIRFDSTEFELMEENKIKRAREKKNIVIFNQARAAVSTYSVSKRTDSRVHILHAACVQFCVR